MERHLVERAQHGDERAFAELAYTAGHRLYADVVIVTAMRESDAPVIAGDVDRILESVDIDGS